MSASVPWRARWWALSAGIRARRLWLGNREDDGRSRGTGEPVSIQVEAKQQGQAAYQTGVFAPGLGARRTGLERRRGGVAAERLEPPAPGNCPAAAYPRRTPPGGKETLGGCDTPATTGPWFCRDGQRRSAV